MSLSVEIKGEVSHIGEVQTFGSGFQKRVVRIDQVGEKFNDTFEIEFIKDRMALVDGLSVGDLCVASCNLSSRYWDKGDRHFMSLSCWKVAEGSENDVAEAVGATDDNGDDFPF